ncbi:associated molecule with the SH3 domain of STAM 2 [Perilla frutescens var. hirtella]|uniref:Associated molecule with the SH3 domain of STAM 2 n=1 Tax=Perilla frutescens var. hirtella TaxID=608512 RepID=A0AAD4J4F8_PERFH|nr:associated molecule with the SH3 domain of STAM 2 [Perilla frutescens var. hirtella]
MSGEICCQVDVHHVTKSFPSPGVSFLQPPPNAPLKNYTSNEHSASKHLKDIHMSQRMMEDFVNAARENTEKNLETCGVLGAFLKDGTFYVTTLIMPKQEATSNSCQAINEEEIYAIQNEESLFPIGWIHTHPSQSCFMSSIDVHTQYTYQVMVPEAVGIVLAPTDVSRKYGIFRLCEPDGMNIIRDCPERGFHLHKEADGTPIYEDCSNIIFNPNLRLEIHDLR